MSLDVNVNPVFPAIFVFIVLDECNGINSSSSAASIFLLTVISFVAVILVVFPLKSNTVAVIVVEPSFNALTFPDSSIVATDGLLDTHFTLLFSISVGFIVLFINVVESTSTFDSPDKVISPTITLIVAVFPFNLFLAVTIVVPAEAPPLTVPLLTVAIFELDDQVISLASPSYVYGICTFFSFLAIIISLAFISRFPTTVTVHVACIPVSFPALSNTLAVIIAFPLPTPVTTPLDFPTVAIFVLFDVHCIG